VAALLVALPMAAGVAIGYAAGGTMRNLVATRFRALWLLWVIAAAQLADVIAAARTWVFVATFAAAVGPSGPLPRAGRTRLHRRLIPASPLTVADMKPHERTGWRPMDKFRVRD
jgi:hypothetical protein